MKEPEPPPLAFLKAKASEIRQHFDKEISAVIPTHSMWYEVYTLREASLAEWGRCVCEACKRYDEDDVISAVSEIEEHDANYHRVTHA